MKKSVFILSFLFALLFTGLSTSGQDINILTYNIRFASFDGVPQNWDKRKEGVYKILKGHDFIGMQEVVPVQMDDIAKNLGDEYSYLFRTRETDPEKGEGCPVLYNKNRWELKTSGFFWLSGTPEIQGSNTWGAAFNRLVTYGIFRERVSGDSILVINTHFDHISQSARENSVDLILQRFSKYVTEMPVVFMGDLNVTPDNPAYREILAGASLTDSYIFKHHPETIKGATFNGWEAKTPVERIDYIFVSPYLKVKCSKVLHDQYKGNYPSDHFPLNTILKFK
jgi:endonuclease/exonuclease/phosphatase family metal-dependent hydrolase